MKENKMNLLQIIEEMKKIEQFPGQTIFEHGLSVRDHLTDLIAYLKGEEKLIGWKIPDWIDTYKEQILSRLLPEDILEEFALFHDIGKIKCKISDENNKIHFPDHAKISHDLWLELGGDSQSAKLMLFDMDIHKLKAEGLEEFCSRKECISLLLSGLAEIHSNAEFQSGIESESFKIKWKQIDRRGMAICKNLFPLK